MTLISLMKKWRKVQLSLKCMVLSGLYCSLISTYMYIYIYIYMLMYSLANAYMYTDYDR